MVFINSSNRWLLSYSKIASLEGSSATPRSQLYPTRFFFEGDSTRNSLDLSINTLPIIAMKFLSFLLPVLAIAAKPPQNLKHHHRVMYCPFDVSTSLSLKPESAAIEVTYKVTQEQKNLIIDKSGCFVQHTLELQDGKMNNAIDMTEVEYEGKGKLNTLSVWSYEYNLAKSAAGPVRMLLFFILLPIWQFCRMP